MKFENERELGRIGVWPLEPTNNDTVSTRISMGKDIVASKEPVGIFSKSLFDHHWVVIEPGKYSCKELTTFEYQRQLHRMKCERKSQKCPTLTTKKWALMA
ncbi:hypothetical protein An11g08640 [Aspergillus niger]|uniref:Uncharacterized protein n=2 Tax=Aspergillus niger TaxID=5061 RepID=A2QXE5_ASPNC|nr:hypothetical protein An11g08640 [Aspergillus niger]CAK46053.1 hypothetical protein An11g08640 [Aspergillus niger]